MLNLTLAFYQGECIFAYFDYFRYLGLDELKVENVSKDLAFALPLLVLVENQRILQGKVEGHLVAERFEEKGLFGW